MKMKKSLVSFVFILTSINSWFGLKFEVTGAKTPKCDQPIVHKGKSH